MSFNSHFAIGFYYCSSGLKGVDASVVAINGLNADHLFLKIILAVSASNFAEYRFTFSHIIDFGFFVCFQHPSKCPVSWVSIISAAQCTTYELSHPAHFEAF